MLTVPTRLPALVLGLALGLALSGCSSTQSPPTQSPSAGDGPTTAGPSPSAAPAETSPSAPPSTPPSTTTPAPSAPGATEGAPPATAGGATGAPAEGWWRPPARTTWQYQLDGELDLDVDAEIFVVDAEDTSAATVGRLHAAGRRVLCYVNAGAWETWRADADGYPEAVLGRPLDGWPGERWLDVRRTDVLLPLIAARMDVCRAKGFDGVETDNVDGYANGSGFPLGAEDQLRFNRALAGLAHERGLAIALKNDVEQVAALEPFFDLAVNEECLVYDECEAYAPFLDAGKPVLHVEYEDPGAAGCRRLVALGVNTIVKDVDLRADLGHC